MQTYANTACQPCEKRLDISFCFVVLCTALYQKLVILLSMIHVCLFLCSLLFCLIVNKNKYCICLCRSLSVLFSSLSTALIQSLSVSLVNNNKQEFLLKFGCSQKSDSVACSIFIHVRVFLIKFTKLVSSKDFSSSQNFGSANQTMVFQ